MTRKGRKVTGGEGPPTHALIHHTLPELRAVQGQKGQKNKKLCEYFPFSKPVRLFVEVVNDQTRMIFNRLKSCMSVKDTAEKFQKGLK